MTPQRFAEIDRVVSLALEREPGERASFIEQTCGADAELRREVETLLKCHEEESPFLADRPLDLLEEFVGQEKRQDEQEAHESRSSLARGAAVGRYQVIGELGSGGMGRVYAAHDPELARKVAIKLMHPEGSRADGGSDGRARLLREAQAMARLSHPNVIAVHDVGTLGQQVFIAMEYVEGSTLARWLADRERSWREVVSMFIQAGRGLAAAHAAGIVHRDFKPDNVLVDKEGRARVFDFGLARPAQLRDIERSAHATAQSTVDGEAPASRAMLGAAVTEAGKVLGTPEYMAPEQLTGGVGDEKADQYSFCVALYQGIYGESPFRGEDVPALLREMMQGTLGRQSRKSSHVPRWLHRTIAQGLSGAPAHRHPSMNALVDQLVRRGRAVRRRWMTLVSLMAIAVLLAGLVAWKERHARLGRIESIAVLPLQNATGDPSQEYFVDGITEELITNLAQISALRVISRNSVMRYKQAKKSILEIAQELGVDGIVDGSVSRSQNRVRITAQLIDGRSDRHLWAKAYEREISDILSLQRDVARAVAAEIAIKLKPEEQARLAAARSVDPEVYAAYLQGRFYWNKRARQSIEKGIEYFKEALHKDPNYAPAYVGLGDCYAYLSTPIHALSPSESARLTKEAALKALSLDDALADAHATLAQVIFRYDWNWAEAEKEFKRAIELNPSYVWARIWYGYYLMSMKRKDEARTQYERAVSLDPLSSNAYGQLGIWFVRDGQYDRAIEQYLKSIELSPTVYTTRFFLAEAYGRRGMYEEAIAAMKKSAELSGDNVPSIGLAGIYASAGRRTDAQSLLEQAEIHPMANRVAFWIAADYAALGRKEDALRWLEQAYEAREFTMPSLSFYWRFDPLRSDPRFQSLLRRMGLPQ